jgi:hypothetical protein
MFHVLKANKTNKLSAWRLSLGYHIGYYNYNYCPAKIYE